MKAVIGFFFGFIVAIGFSGRAVDLSLEHGQCRFGAERDGTFWQSDYGRSNYMTPRCTSIALADKWEKGGRMGWRVAYLTTGDIEARDNAAVLNDLGIRNAPCSPSTGAWDGCVANFNGSGHMRGVSFSGTGDLKLGPITAIGEFGLLFFKSQFKATATPINYVGRVEEVNEESHWYDMPIPMMGLTLRYKNVFISARHYWPAEHRAISLTNHAFTQLSLGVTLWRF